MVSFQPRACEYSSERKGDIETVEEFMNNSVPFARSCLEEFSEKYGGHVGNSYRIATCRHRKRRFSEGYKITRTGYLRAADIKLETPTLRVDALDEDHEDKYFRSGAVFMDQNGRYHIVEYYNSEIGYYAVDRGIFDAEQVATLLAKAYAERVGFHSNLFADCLKNKLESAILLFS